MSADNGVYILRTTSEWKHVEYENGFSAMIRWDDLQHHPVFRVAHTQGIDTLEWFEENQPYNVGAFMHQVWKDSKVFYEEDEAFHEAKRLHDTYDYTEYGICLIKRDQYVFYGD